MSFTIDRIDPVDHDNLDGGENQLKIWALSVIPEGSECQLQLLSSGICWSRCVNMSVGMG